MLALTGSPLFSFPALFALPVIEQGDDWLVHDEAGRVVDRLPSVPCAGRVVDRLPSVPCAGCGERVPECFLQSGCCPDCR